MSRCNYEVQLFEPRIDGWLTFEKEWTKAKGVKSYEFAKNEWPHVRFRLLECNDRNFEESVLYEWVPGGHRETVKGRVHLFAHDFGDLLIKQHLKDCTMSVNATFNEDEGWRFKIIANPTDVKNDEAIVLASGMDD